MLRMYRNANQEATIKRKGPNDPDDYIRVRVLDIDLLTGRVEIGISATDKWVIYRSENPRSDYGDTAK